MKQFQPQDLLTIDQFKEMDRMALDIYSLPIELMMENADLQLARLIPILRNYLLLN